MAASMQIAVDLDGAHAPRPVHVHEFARLADGTQIVLRPIQPEDDDLERAFIHGLSRDSRYNRLLGARKLTPEEVRRLTRIDYRREMAVVAVTAIGGQAHLLGVARYIRVAHPDGAEFALVVADAWQGKGVGTLLLQALQRYARAAGIARLHGVTLATNQAMQNLARKLGFVQRADPQDATLRLVEMRLPPEAASAPAALGAAHGTAANDAGQAPGGTARALACAVGPLSRAAGTSAGDQPGSSRGHADCCW